MVGQPRWVPYRLVASGPARLVVLSLLVVLFAGCFGGSNSSPQATDAPLVTATFDEATGGIEGTVVDEEELPLAGIQAGILFLDHARAVTDDLGRFALSNIPPGAHEVIFQGIGYLGGREAVTVEAGAKSDLLVRLARDPAFIVQDPYTVFPQPKAGSIGCAYGAGGEYGTMAFGKDWCGSVTNVGQNEAPSSVRFDKDAGQNLTGFLVSARWQPGTVVTGGNQLQINLPITDQASLRTCQDCISIGLNRVQGPPGFVAYYDSFDPQVWLVHPDEAVLRFAAAIANGNSADTSTWGGLIVQQQFELVVLLLYNGAQPPLDLNLWGDE